MKAVRWLLALGLAQGVWSQSWPIRIGPPPARAGGGQHPQGGVGVNRPVRIIRGWGGGWGGGWSGGWGGGWGWGSSEPLRVVIQSEQPKEKEAPPYVTNKEYVTERLTPRWTEVVSAPSAPALSEWKDCNVRLISGERFEAAQCAESDDMILVRAQSGRRYRFGRDLVDSLR